MCTARSGTTCRYIAGPLIANRDELTAHGWSVEIVPGADHMSAMQVERVLPIFLPWLRGPHM